jgi:hypothetical protein
VEAHEVRRDEEETVMAYRFLPLIALFAMLATAGAAAAQECGGPITADEAMKAELARYAAQTSNDFATWTGCSAAISPTTTPPPPKP